jgi:predicted nucleic acid-binding Zn finger protein
MHLRPQILPNYVLERRFCVPSKASFIGEHVRRGALDTIVRVYNVTFSRSDDKNTHRDASQTDCSFISEPFAKHK